MLFHPLHEGLEEPPFLLVIARNLHRKQQMHQRYHGRQMQRITCGDVECGHFIGNAVDNGRQYVLIAQDDGGVLVLSIAVVF